MSYLDERGISSQSDFSAGTEKVEGMTLPLYFFAFAAISSVVSLFFGVAFKTWNSCEIHRAWEAATNPTDY
jgi:hypothetical protein